MSTAPIAVVSSSCIFPGSLSPQALWKNLLESRDLLTKPRVRRWRAEPARAMDDSEWDHRAGYVEGFDAIFDPDAYALDPSFIQSLDPLFHWVLHTSRQAYLGINGANAGDLAVILGNLSLPTGEFSKWTEAVWTGQKRPHELNRFMSGLPAHLVGPALGRRADAFSLDAACASSLYAIKLGCEKLREYRADIVLAGAANRADPLFLHIGFDALQALSPTGQSRPFHRDADGLIPTEGAAFVGLKRLKDAVDDGDEIQGIIHDVGLSNDGRSDGLLVPAGEGQVRAIRRAYEEIDVAPSQISYVECHATGTPVGDGREIRSMAEVFAPDREIAVGSHKSNMGHAITAAGMAGLLKILGAMKNEVIPATIHCDRVIDVFDETPFELVTRRQPWTEERKLAALSAFGFGGNNSHLVVENWRGNPDIYRGAELSSAQQSPRKEVAVAGVGIVSSVAQGIDEFRKFLLGGGLPDDRKSLEEIELPLEELRFPPSDLADSLPQQLAILRAACDAVEQAGSDRLSRERTGVFIGMQTDPDIVRHGLRARQKEKARRAAIADRLTAANVVGSLPNIVTNRINSHFDFGGYSFSTSAEEQSGVVALREAVEAIDRGDLDAAIVGAVEMATAEAHLEADAGDGPVIDAAVALVLTTGDSGLATITDSDSRAVEIETPRAHSATGLMQIAAAIAVPHFGLPRRGPPTGLTDKITITTPALEAPPRKTAIRRQPKPVLVDPPLIHRVEYRGSSIYIAANSESHLSDRLARLEKRPEDFEPPSSPKGPSQVAQVFTGAAAAYHGMGRDLILGFPRLVESLRERFEDLDVASRWMFHPDDSTPPTPLDKLFASSVLAQLHSDFTRRFLGIEFDAALGFSSGETNALFATGVWRDFDGLLREFAESNAFTRHLGGEFEVLRKAWSDHLEPGESPDWRSVRIVAPRQKVQEAIADEPLVHLILINTPGDVAIGGHAPVVQRVLQRLEGYGTSALDYDIAVHCPELELFEKTWNELHTRKTYPTDIRLYSHAFCDHYEPDSERVAEALLKQALGPVDFPALITRAWDDGIRIFVEHGPRTTLGPWISSILGDRPHRVVSLDSSDDKSLMTLANAVASLANWGVDVDVEAYNDHIRRHGFAKRDEDRRLISFPAHRKPVRIAMPPAPKLPPVGAGEKADRTPARDIAGTNGKKDGADTPELPAYFRHQQRAFRRFMDVMATQSRVHQQFLEQSRRGWQAFRSSSGLREVAPGRRRQVRPTIFEDRAPSKKTSSAVSDQPVGPTFSRRDLEVHASGDISQIFGPLFERQRDFPRQVRMPEPPLLLADRVTGIDAEPGVVAKGTVWTETDITSDAWYVRDGRIPPGVMIEAGQADLFLISWMGADFRNRGERIYRLLGCELTYRGGLPTVGDTLKYDIHIDGHAEQGDVRLFFFHYDCRVDGDIRLSVRNGQAGFFTDEELRNSMGILWEPEAEQFCDDSRLDPPRIDREAIPEKLSQRQVRKFAAGQVSACFGAGYERLFTHSDTPNIDEGRMCFVGDVDELDPDGGPAGRGYMRTTYEISQDSWFFEGHFKDDPCMPGTLMFEGGMQVMSFYMIALGLTLDRDGWRFEPVPDVAYQLRCRGQATPANRELVYEIFVEELIDGDEPTLVADILATVDGLKAFHCRGMRMRLVPDTPLGKKLIARGVPRRDERALRQGDVVHDALAMEATSNGPATLCMGEAYRRFDGSLRMPRLPGEPFQFMSRVTSADAAPGDAGPGTAVEVEYDIPDDAWYFGADGGRSMPYSVIMEAALQPCGWLSLYSGAVLDSDQPLYYRNLDGTATLHDEIDSRSGRLVTRTTLTRDSRSGGMVIQSFDVECSIHGEPVFEMETTFGFFPYEALQNQVGLASSEHDQRWLSAESDFRVDLSTPPDGDHPQLWPSDELRMIDAVSGRWTDGQSHRYRAEKRVDPSEWFFKAHFYEDPVQPGSLGVEAMLQTLRFALLDGGYHRRFDSPRIEPAALDREISWKYRGQVLPENERIEVLLEVVDVDEEKMQTTASAKASLWVDGLEIYAARIAMRIVEDASGGRLDGP